MSFSERQKTIALAIVKIFETGKPIGDYSAIGVMDDGAGISYGTSQFTHRSGSLAAVLTRFVRLGGKLPDVVADALPDFRTGRNIGSRAGNRALKAELAALGKNELMRRAQREIAFENYLQPALQACEGSDFVYPLSLAVIYDSINQGGYARVRDRVKFQGPANGSIKPEEFEKEWITEYCQRRVSYLKSLKSSAARASVYRPNFFLDQIKKGNWNLNLPMVVHGHKLTEAMLFPKNSTADSNGGNPHSPANSTQDKEETQSQAPDSSSSETSGGPVVEQKTLEQSGEGGQIVTTQAAEGTNPHTDEAAQVSQNGTSTQVLAGVGGVTGIVTAVWGFITANPSVLGIGIICITVLILAIIFRKAILDAIRMQTAADPSKYNVK